MDQDSQNFHDFEGMFDELSKTREEKPYDYAEKIVANLEAEYKNMPSDRLGREKEKTDLLKKLEDLSKSLRKSKNVKNHRKVQLNQQLAEKRKRIKAEMEKVKDALYNISIEEKGSDISSQRLVDATIANK